MLQACRARFDFFCVRYSFKDVYYTRCLFAGFPMQGVVDDIRAKKKDKQALLEARQPLSA